MNYIYIPIIHSTQTYIKENITLLPDMTWVCSGFQTEGKGQFDRVWESQQNMNVLCSVLLKERPNTFPTDIQLKISAILIDLLHTYGIEAYYKAPNDIYASNKKICGILVETKIYEKTKDIIIGIGLNVNQMAFDEKIQATSMKLEQAFDFQLEEIIEVMIEKTQMLFT